MGEVQIKKETSTKLLYLFREPSRCGSTRRRRDRIINYDYYQTEQICGIASDAVESTVKQIDRRLKISGAQWKIDNVSQVLKHRCAYLNNTLLAE